MGRAPSGPGRRLRGSGKTLLHGSGNLFVMLLSGGGRRGAGLGAPSALGAHGNNFETRARLGSEVLGGRVCGPAAGSGGERPPAALLFVRRRPPAVSRLAVSLRRFRYFGLWEGGVGGGPAAMSIVSAEV